MTAQDSALARRVNRLAAERVDLFAKAATQSGLTESERTRLKAIERDLDECYILRRKQRAAQDARPVNPGGPRHLPRSNRL